VRAVFASAELTIEAEGARLSLADGWMSPAYGVRVPTPFVSATTPGRAGENTARFVLSVA
jgi:hypothetical protein